MIPYPSTRRAGGLRTQEIGMRLVSIAAIGLLCAQDLFGQEAEEVAESLLKVEIVPRHMPSWGTFRIEVTGAHGAGPRHLPEVSIHPVRSGEPVHLDQGLIRIMESTVNRLVLAVDLPEGVSTGPYEVDLRLRENVPFVPIICVESAQRAALIAFAITLIAILVACWIGHRRFRRFSPFVFIWGHDERSYSLSKFQILLWTLVIGFLTIYVFMVTHELLVFSKEIVVLLGISGASSVSSRVLGIRRSRKEGTPAHTEGREPRWTDLFMESGEVSLQKLQMFLWTLILAYIVIDTTVRTMSTPAISAELLALMGVSHGTYVIGKAGDLSKLSGKPG